MKRRLARLPISPPQLTKLLFLFFTLTRKREQGTLSNVTRDDDFIADPDIL